MENGLKFLAGMFWIMFLDMEGVSEGDYRHSGFPLENFTESKNVLFNLNFYLSYVFYEVCRNSSWS